MRWSPSRPAVWAAFSYLIVAALQAWPLPLHLGTRLTGPIGGDTGVYVWNTWVFGHELIERGTSPFSTAAVLSLDSDADLSLHNYTTFANILALPLQPWLGVVGAFNATYLINVALAGFGMFLLARRVTGRNLESWLAGFAFACAPFIVARATAHFSLVAAAPLPFFLYFLDRAWHSLRTRDAIAAGVTVAWAHACDPYYAVYCVMIGAAFVAARTLSVQAPLKHSARIARARTVIDVAFVALLCLIVGVHFVGGGSVRMASVSISMRTLYTPVLILTLLGLVRLGIGLRPQISLQPLPPLAQMLRVGAIAIIVTTVMLAPTLVAMGRRVADGRLVSAPVLWRSSAPGVDLLAYFLPNPNHPLSPPALVQALSAQPGGYAEQVASVPLVILAVIGIAWMRTRFRPGKFWIWLTIGFVVISLGPFVQVFGLNTHIPTPWALLRYLPLVGAARMPARFAIVAMMGACVIFAIALTALVARYPQRRRQLLAAVAVLLAFEVLPAPRVLYSATIPSIYQTIAADPRPIRVLELPFGVRDGLSSLGDFSASAQFYQTAHHKRLVGGYLSRVAQQRKNVYLFHPVLGPLIQLSEGRALTEFEVQRAQNFAGMYISRYDVGYVVMETSRMNPGLRRFAMETLRLRHVATDGDKELYVPEARH